MHYPTIHHLTYKEETKKIKKGVCRIGVNELFTPFLRNCQWKGRQPEDEMQLMGKLKPNPEIQIKLFFYWN